MRKLCSQRARVEHNEERVTMRCFYEYFYRSDRTQNPSLSTRVEISRKHLVTKRER